MDKPAAKAKPKDQKLNVYNCPVASCSGRLVTREIHEGTTPSHVPCKVTLGCKGLMQSVFYAVKDPKMEPTHEWYKPSGDEYTSLPTHALDHVRNGGLLLRKIEKS